MQATCKVVEDMLGNITCGYFSTFKKNYETRFVKVIESLNCSDSICDKRNGSNASDSFGFSKDEALCQFFSKAMEFRRKNVMKFLLELHPEYAWRRICFIRDFIALEAAIYFPQDFVLQLIDIGLRSKECAVPFDTGVSRFLLTSGKMAVLRRYLMIIYARKDDCIWKTLKRFSKTSMHFWDSFQDPLIWCLYNVPNVSEKLCLKLGKRMRSLPQPLQNVVKVFVSRRWKELTIFSTELGLCPVHLAVLCPVDPSAALRRVIAADKLCVNDRDEHGWTALHYACVLGSVPMISYLLNMGAATNIRTKQGHGLVDVLSVSIAESQLKQLCMSISSMTDK